MVRALCVAPLLLVCVSAFGGMPQRGLLLQQRQSAMAPLNIFGKKDPEKEAYREEQFRIQQEMLKRRRDPEAMDEYFRQTEMKRRGAPMEFKKTAVEPPREVESTTERLKKADDTGAAEDFMSKMGDMFGGDKKKKDEPAMAAKAEPEAKEEKKFFGLF